MAYWLNHPRYVPFRDRLVEHLHSKSQKYRFRRLNNVMFLCGAADRSQRDNLRDYLTSHYEELSIFYAEPVWAVIANLGKTALEIEQYLASLADIVVVIVESPGTFTELGAFSFSEPLRYKLLPIVDSKYERDNESFIMTGPVRWVNQDSFFRPTVYVTFPQILRGMEEIEERLGRLPRPKTTRIADLAASPKHLVFFVCDLVAVLAPATTSLITYYVNNVLRCDKTHEEIATLLGVANAMGLLEVHHCGHGTGSGNYYFRPPADALARPFHRRRIDLPSLRASHLSVLQTIPESAEIIADVHA